MLPIRIYRSCISMFHLQGYFTAHQCRVDTMILIWNRYQVRYLKVSIRYEYSPYDAHCPVCQDVLAVVDQTRMKQVCLIFKPSISKNKNKRGVILRPKQKRSDYPWGNAIHQLGFFLFPPYFPPIFRYQSFRKCMDAIPIPKSTQVSSTRYRPITTAHVWIF